MRDKVIHKVVNFILRFASKEYSHNLTTCYKLGMLVWSKPEIAVQLLDKDKLT